MLFKDGRVCSACPGGSMLNSAVSLGRAGAEVFLLTEFADDEVGNMICRFLKENNVSAEHVSIYPDRKSPLALAFLNRYNDAIYSFYEDFPEKRYLKTASDLRPDDIVMFGSILAVSKETEPGLREFLDAAKGAGSTILYDPNFRAPHMQTPEATRMIRENIGYADIVRASDEDMRNIEGICNADDAYEYVHDNGCKCLVYTAGSKGVSLRAPSVSKYYVTPEITTVSTVGAGDSFNAGIVYQLLREDISNEKTEAIQEPVWDRIIGRGIDFASDVCKRSENYISEGFAARIKG
ncbi:MAG: carbohydrate kinase [Methanolobus sp.]|nr:carbohydrate kinase [Methanolobus sp.]